MDEAPTVVPLDGATASRDHISVAFTKQAVTDGPQVDGDEPLGPGDRSALAEHYGSGSVDAGAELESAQQREANAARSAELADEIRELDREAAKKRDDEHKHQQKAEGRGTEAEALEQRKLAAEQEARELGG